MHHFLDAPTYAPAIPDEKGTITRVMQIKLCIRMHSRKVAQYGKHLFFPLCLINGNGSSNR